MKIFLSCNIEVFSFKISMGTYQSCRRAKTPNNVNRKNNLLFHCPSDKIYFQYDQIYFRCDQTYFQYEQIYFQFDPIYFPCNQIYFLCNQKHFSCNQNISARINQEEDSFPEHQYLEICMSLVHTIVDCGSELQKRADRADQSVLIFTGRC